MSYPQLPSANGNYVTSPPLGKHPPWVGCRSHRGPARVARPSRRVSTMTLKISLEVQEDEVGEAVRARYSMVASILRAMLYSQQTEIINALGGREKITLEQLARIYQEGSGDFGVCFEYALHDSIRARHKSIYPTIQEVLHSFCKIKGQSESILFGLEKNGTLNVVETAKNSLTQESRVLGGKAGKPPYLRHRVALLDRAFRSVKHRNSLPQSIAGLWNPTCFSVPQAQSNGSEQLSRSIRKRLWGPPACALGCTPPTSRKARRRTRRKT